MTELERETEALRVLVREAHESIKDLRQVQRETAQALTEAREELANLQATYVTQLVQTSMAAYHDRIEAAVVEGTAAAHRRFDELSAMLLGEDGRTRRRGRPSIPELMEARSVLDRMQS